jgi:pimeloyl-ACP methyl ester carboxylesterase
MQVARKPVAWLSPHAIARTALVILLAMAWQPAQSLAVKSSRHHDEVYLVRGLANVFSLGLNQLGGRLRAKGVDVTVMNHTGWRGIVRRIVEDRERYGARPVVLVGHSLGGNAVIWIAKALGEHKIKVSYMATLAAPAPAPVPPNVRRVVNYYFSFGIGAKLVGAEGFHGALENRDCSGMRGVNHFNVDDQEAIQKEIAGRVLRVVR